MRVRSVTLLAFVLLIAAACSSSSSPTATASSSTSSSSAVSSTAASSSSSAAGTATLAVATNATLGKQIVVESTGRTVYLFVPDGSSTTSQVPQSIKANWPPVTAGTAPTAGEGIDATKLSTATQPDGTQQVMYNGHLLYLFAGDKAPGDAKGQGLINNWYVLSPAGDQITS
jgi:predicted lipoprotein with Yx(FWY)xxD motif